MVVRCWFCCCWPIWSTPCLTRRISDGGFSLLLIASFLLVLLLLARPLGGFMARLIEGELPALRGVEAGVWRACGIRATEMNWWQYALAIPAFNLLGRRCCSPC